jgi:hypothetical protein
MHPFGRSGRAAMTVASGTGLLSQVVERGGAGRGGRDCGVERGAVGEGGAGAPRASQDSRTTGQLS